eukprot:345449_1
MPYTMHTQMPYTMPTINSAVIRVKTTIISWDAPFRIYLQQPTITHANQRVWCRQINVSIRYSMLGYISSATLIRMRINNNVTVISTQQYNHAIYNNQHCDSLNNKQFTNHVNQRGRSQRSQTVITYCIAMRDTFNFIKCWSKRFKKKRFHALTARVLFFWNHLSVSLFKSIDTSALFNARMIIAPLCVLVCQFTIDLFVFFAAHLFPITKRNSQQTGQTFQCSNSFTFE